MGTVRSDSADTALITVLMPVKHYHPRLLRESLESVFTQTSDRWRLIIVVDPGDEDAPRAVRACIENRAHARIVVNQGRKLAGAFNTGMRAAETEFAAILLADDLWAPTAVEVLEDNIHVHPRADLFHSGLRFVDENRQPISPIRHPPQKVSLDDFVRGSPLKHLLCWRVARALSFGGMDESLNNVGPDDFDFPWSMLEHGAVVRAIDQCLYEYRDHRESYRLTTHLPRNVHLREIRRILKKHGVPPLRIARQLLNARFGFLRQCLYRNGLHRWIRENITGVDPAKGWREPVTGKFAGTVSNRRRSHG